LILSTPFKSFQHGVGIALRGARSNLISLGVGRFFQDEQEHRLAKIAAEQSCQKEDAEQKRLRLEIAAVERQLRGEAVGKVSG
jgi:hypothetical protein